MHMLQTFGWLPLCGALPILDDCYTTSNATLYKVVVSTIFASIRASPKNKMPLQGTLSMELEKILSHYGGAMFKGVCNNENNLWAAPPQ